MLFNSMAYMLFLPIVFLLYWLLPHKFRWALVLAASYYFYMSWNAKYVFLILFTTLVSYFAALLLERAQKPQIKKLILALTLIACLGVLFFFKYFNFFFDSLTALFSVFAIKLSPITLKVLLPVGISFYTFQTLSYVIDVYKGQVHAEKHFGIYAAFISFFPQLVAGPIERTQNLLPQIRAEHRIDYDKAARGLKLMAWGYFKKLAVADNLSVYVDTVFNNVHAYRGFPLVIAAFFFTIQIYCDFSGYSDIAIGSAKLLGIDLMTNFKSPYFSASVKEFWSRWHISLSTWFRDYVYIPLGGNRVSRLRHKLNLMITFLVSGLWHGANWTFVLWGGVHGLAQVIENLFLRKTPKNRFTALVRTLCVFVFCAFAWIFFRAGTISEAGYVIAHLLSGIGSPAAYIRDGLYILELSKPVIARIGFTLLVLAAYDYAELKTSVIDWVSARPAVIRWGIYLLLVFMIVCFAPTSNEAQFIYFQF